MFNYFDIQRIIGEANKEYNTLESFTENIFVNTKDELMYLGSRGQEVPIDIGRFKRTRSYCDPIPAQKKAVLHGHDGIFNAIHMLSQRTEPENVETAVKKLESLLPECPDAHAFLINHVFLSNLNTAERLAIFFMLP